MQKNVASQKLIVFAFDSTTNLPRTGDAANISAYVDIDFGGVTVLGTNTATELDSTNARGYYSFPLAQAETNGNTLLFTARSSTSNIVVVGAPAAVFTTPANFAALGLGSNGHVSNVDTCTTNTDMRGTDNALLAGSYTAPDNADVVTLLGDTVTLLSRIGANVALAGTAPLWYAAPVDVSANVSAIKARTDNLPAVPAAVGSAMTLAGGSISDATFSAPAEAAGRPTGILGMVRRIWEWQVNKRTRDRSAGTVSLRNASDTGTLETQVQSTSGTTDTQTQGS